MADTIQFDLVSPERKLASVAATAVELPGSEGDMTAMADHMPLITTLRPGIVRVTGPDGVQEFLVTGGFAEVTATSTSVLAENALPRAEVTSKFMAGVLAEAEAARETATPKMLDAANKLVADVLAIGDALGAPAR